MRGACTLMLRIENDLPGPMPVPSARALRAYLVPCTLTLTRQCPPAGPMAETTGVIYCYRNRHQGDTDSTKIPTKEQQLNGKTFGRATPQYGSYGAKRR